MSTSKRSRFNADLFGSVCYTFQHGKFTKDFGDLTRVDARLDIPSASAFAKKVLNGFKSTSTDVSEPSASPRLNLIFQQQVLYFSPFDKSKYMECKFCRCILIIG